MICQLCLTKIATHNLTERSFDGRFVEAQYCEDCYAAKYRNPQPRRAPRLSFTIKSFMILAGVWALPNAVTAWIMRSGWFTGTPAQMRIWTIQAFLAVNLVFGFFFGWIGLMAWFSRLMWHNQTGGLIPMPNQKVDRRQLVALLIRLPLLVLSILAWSFAAIFAAKWLAPKFGMAQIQLMNLLMLAPALPIIILSFMKNKHLRDRIYQFWRTASPTERALRAVGAGVVVRIHPRDRDRRPASPCLGLHVLVPHPAGDPYLDRGADRPDGRGRLDRQTPLAGAVVVQANCHGHLSCTRAWLPISVSGSAPPRQRWALAIFSQAICRKCRC